MSGVFTVIHKDLFGQKEEIDKKTFLSYYDIPSETRQKVLHVINDNVFYGRIGGLTGQPLTDDYRKLSHEICKYKGIPDISILHDGKKELSEWLKSCSIEDFLRTIELFIYIKEKETPGFNIRLHNTVNDINDIFRIDKIGYEIVNERFIRKDSEFLQEQVIKQTINLLYTNGFKGPLEEFQEALDHYMLKQYEDTIHKSNKAFESTMKSVLTKLNISFSPDDTAETLLERLIKKELIYKYTKSLFMGLPMIRNKQGGHGQGIDPKEVNQSYAELTLNLAGTFIVFLVTRYQELK